MKNEKFRNKNRKKEEFQVRTDLALEQRECVPGDGGEIAGVSLREWTGEQSLVKLSEVRILDGRGAEAMGKPQGTYLTLEAPQLAKRGEECQEAVSRELAIQIQRLSASLLKHHLTGREGNEAEAGIRILAVGLGNHLVTPDSLGPETIGNLQMTRHLESQMGPGFLQ